MTSHCAQATCAEAAGTHRAAPDATLWANARGPSPSPMSSEPPPVRVGVVGLGYWGPNLARNFAAIPGCELTWLCDADAQARAKLEPSFPAARSTASLEDLLDDSELDAIVLAT